MFYYKTRGSWTPLLSHDLQHLTPLINTEYTKLWVTRHIQRKRHERMCYVILSIVQNTRRFNIWRPSDAIWHPRSPLILFELISCPLLSTKPLPDPMLPYYKLDTKWNFNQYTNIFNEDNAFENVSCKVAASMCRYLNIGCIWRI